MSGGSWEYPMGVMVDESEKPISGYSSVYNSGFVGSYLAGGNNITGYEWPDPSFVLQGDKKYR